MSFMGLQMQQATIEWCIAPPSWHPPPTPSAIPASLAGSLVRI